MQRKTYILALVTLMLACKPAAKKADPAISGNKAASAVAKSNGKGPQPLPGMDPKDLTKYPGYDGLPASMPGSVDMCQWRRSPWQKSSGWGIAPCVQVGKMPQGSAGLHLAATAPVSRIFTYGNANYTSPPPSASFHLVATSASNSSFGLAASGGISYYFPNGVVSKTDMAAFRAMPATDAWTQNGSSTTDVSRSVGNGFFEVKSGDGPSTQWYASPNGWMKIPQGTEGMWQPNATDLNKPLTYQQDGKTYALQQGGYAVGWQKDANGDWAEKSRITPDGNEWKAMNAKDEDGNQYFKMDGTSGLYAITKPGSNLEFDYYRTSGDGKALQKVPDGDVNSAISQAQSAYTNGLQKASAATAPTTSTPSEEDINKEINMEWDPNQTTEENPGPFNPETGTVRYPGGDEAGNGAANLH